MLFVRLDRHRMTWFDVLGKSSIYVQPCLPLPAKRGVRFCMRMLGNRRPFEGEEHGAKVNIAFFLYKLHDLSHTTAPAPLCHTTAGMT